MPNIDNFTIDDGSVKWKFKLLNENTNIIESISVDGVRQSIDGNKNVNITLNTTYATKDELNNYVKSSELSGITSGNINKINSIALNGTDLVITDKKVNIPLFNSSIDGAVPKSDGSNKKFLRADGQWIEIKREPTETPILSISKTDVELNDDNLVDTITLNTNSDGSISVISNDENVCTVSYNSNNKTITVTYVNDGYTTITVSISATDTYKAIVKTITVNNTNNTLSPILDENTIEEIVQAARDGVAETLWSVGDIYPIILNGTLGPNTLENVEVGLQIIGFNHNPTIEGNNTIHFQCGVKDGIPIALYWNNDESQPRHHTNVSTNTGGWEQSEIRTELCPQFYNCLPQVWKDVIQTTTKYTNNVGDTNDEDAVTATEDKVFILAEYEVFGAITYSNQYEQNKQQQYEYYINGTPYSNWDNYSRTQLLLSSLSVDSSPRDWWLRSPFYSNIYNFCCVSNDGNTFNNNDHRSATAVSVASSKGDFGSLTNGSDGPGVEYYSSIKKITPLSEDQENVTLTGNKNANTLYVYKGDSNVLTGGLNADTFVFKGGGGVVTDFGITALNDLNKTYAKTTTTDESDTYYAYSRKPNTDEYPDEGLFYSEGKDTLQVAGEVTKIEFEGAVTDKTTSNADRYFSAYVTYTDSEGEDQVIKLDNINKALNKRVYVTNYVAAQSLNIKDSTNGDSVLTGTSLTSLFTDLDDPTKYSKLDALTVEGTNKVTTNAAPEAEYLFSADYTMANLAGNSYASKSLGFAPAFVIS